MRPPPRRRASGAALGLSIFLLLACRGGGEEHPRLFFLSASELYSVRADGSNLTLEGEDLKGAVSPDHQRFAFECRADGDEGLLPTDVCLGMTAARK